MAQDISELTTAARQIRGKLIELSHNTGTPHLGSSLSCVDILVAAYWQALRIDPERHSDPERDRFILSKGHAATTLYATLAYRGFFPLALLDTYTKNGGCLAEHPGPGCVPGVEAATGSLGHGLPIGLGMALSARLQKRSYRVFVVMSDGECNEGSVWEAALLAPANKLDNLAVVIDYNKWQATGRSNTITSLQPLKEKWQAFGWSVCEVDGHDLATLSSTLTNVPDGTGRPVAVIAHTIKGKGVSFMEDDNNWHYRSPNQEELQKAWVELGLA